MVVQIEEVMIVVPTVIESVVLAEVGFGSVGVVGGDAFRHSVVG